MWPRVARTSPRRTRGGVRGISRRTRYPNARPTQPVRPDSRRAICVPVVRAVVPGDRETRRASAQTGGDERPSVDPRRGLRGRCAACRPRDSRPPRGQTAGPERTPQKPSASRTATVQWTIGANGLRDTRPVARRERRPSESRLSREGERSSPGRRGRGRGEVQASQRRLRTSHRRGLPADERSAEPLNATRQRRPRALPSNVRMRCVTA